MEMKFHVKRDCDTLRLRKVVIECFVDPEVKPRDKRRMFAGPLFELRLKRKMKRMARLVKKMLKAEKEALK